MCDWTLDEASTWLQRHVQTFTLAGFTPVIIDSVARGASAALDLVLVPAAPMPLRAAVAIFLAEILPHVSPDRTVAVVPAAEPRLGRLIRVTTHEDRIVRCFFPTRHYDAPQLM